MLFFQSIAQKVINNFLAVSYLSLFSQRQNNINQILTPTYLK